MRPLGLATGAEFLLARTETGLENRIEEVWWQMGMEWADRNGANIINSSLGYGKDRYNPDEMDGTSLVAKAAQMAAAKGILVCNSMGNEGDDPTWRTVITPADAEGVLSVGGIDRDGNPSSFTSWGPSADGRIKPNVIWMISPGALPRGQRGLHDMHCPHAQITSDRSNASMAFSSFRCTVSQICLGS